MPSFRLMVDKFGTPEATPSVTKSGGQLTAQPSLQLLPSDPISLSKVYKLKSGFALYFPPTRISLSKATSINCSTASQLKKSTNVPSGVSGQLSRLLNMPSPSES